jgi:hypothetical protein
MQGQAENPQPLIGVGGDPLPAMLGGAEREYIWGPGDGPAGIYEILVQFDMSRSPWWMLQDAGGDLVAMCVVGGSGVGGSARVVHSYQFDAYGQCLRASQLIANSSTFVVPYTRLGHKGLFLDRIDVGVATAVGGGTSTTYVDNPRVVGGGYGSGGTLASPTGSIVRYFVNNRSYTPEYAIWNQRDPNHSGQVVLDDLGFHGETIHPASIRLGMLMLYGDGGSLRQYLASSPHQRHDPSGLFIGMVGMAATMPTMVTVNADYNDEVLSAGISLRSMVQDYFGFGYSMAVMDMMDTAMDWSASDEVLLPSMIDEMAESVPVKDGPAQAGIITSAWKKAARAVNKKGNVAHHIVSHYGKAAANFRDMLSKNGVSTFDFQDVAMNMAEMSSAFHKGRHRNVYHQNVLNEVKRALEQGEKNIDTVRRTLDRIRRDLESGDAARIDKWMK